MQKIMEIAGSEVWAASRMVATFTAVISLPLLLSPPQTTLIVMSGGDLHSLKVRDTIFFSQKQASYLSDSMCVSVSSLRLFIT
jgi:hypothetical protein